MIDSSWTDYCFKRAPRGILCQFERRVETVQSTHPQIQMAWTGYADDLHPEYNIAGLYWRLTGIGKHELEAMPAQVREQVLTINIWQCASQGLFGNGGLLQRLAQNGFECPMEAAPHAT